MWKEKKYKISFWFLFRLKSQQSYLDSSISSQGFEWQLISPVSPKDKLYDLSYFPLFSRGIRFLDVDFELNNNGAKPLKPYFLSVIPPKNLS